MKLRPFFRYYGGKWRAAPRYPEPKFDMIVEPFAGAAGYSTRHPDRKVILVDSYEPIAAIWSWLTRVSESDFRALPAIGEGQTVDDFGLSQEARWFLGFWMNNGTASPCKSPSKWALQYPDRAGWTEKTREKLAVQLQYIRHWTVIHGDYARSAPDVEATWFVDPPYDNAAGRHYIHGSSSLCFRELGIWCESRRGQVIVCESDGADWLPFTPLFENRGTPHPGRVARRVESVWLREAA